MNEAIDAIAEQFKAELRAMAEEALREVDRSLGFPQSFSNRSLGQRRRYASKRQLEKA